MVAVIDHGKIVAIDTPYRLKQQYTKDKAYITTTDEAKLEKFLALHGLVYKNKKTHYSIEINDIPTLMTLFNEQKDLIVDLEVKKGTLNDVFIAITGKDIREAEAPNDEAVSTKKGGKAQ